MNDFYSIKKTTDYSNKKEYDLPYLTQMSVPTIWVSGNKPYKTFYREPKDEDYDDIFVTTLENLVPITKVKHFLEYHYESYYTKENRISQDFLEHIEYVILPKIRVQAAKNISIKFIKSKYMLNNEQYKQENDTFLIRAYEEAIKENASYPLLVEIDTWQIGKGIGFNETTVERVVNELHNQKYLKSDIGMITIWITQNGLNYLYKLNTINQGEANIVYNTHNTTIHAEREALISFNSPYSQQTINKNNEIDNFKTLLNELRSSIDLVKKELSPEDVVDLENNLLTIENQLPLPNPNKNRLQNAKEIISQIILSIPSNIVANLLSEPLQVFLNSTIL